MQQYHERKHTRSGTGAKFGHRSDKKLHQIGGHFAETKVSDKDVVVKARMRGGKIKMVPLYASFANVVMPGNKIKKAKIKTVVASPNNPHFTRMNIITKGVTIDTEVGKAIVTNRPGQDGVVNAKLITQ